jgi:hypothetical protein
MMIEAAGMCGISVRLHAEEGAMLAICAMSVVEGAGEQTRVEASVSNNES